MYPRVSQGPQVMAHNVLRLPTAREPTVRAAKGCPPPFIEAHFIARGGQRRSRAAAKAC